MNAERRKQLNKVLESLELAKATLEELKDEEQEYIDNMPESFQYGEKGDKATEVIDRMDDAMSNIDDAIDNINNAIE